MSPAPVKPTVPFSTLEGLDIRVGTIIAVEEVPQSSKLVRLVVSFGDHTRSILAGIKKERANPAELPLDLPAVHAPLAVPSAAVLVKGPGAIVAPVTLALHRS